jgi:hypothetical protein
VDFLTAENALEQKKQSPQKVRAGDRVDTKVLEWTSFAPTFIRQRYLASKQHQQQKLV